jgi:phosphatidylserine/phosphatidylglycerophosphate/cardiolipin synthase-like enzyme
MQLAVHANSDHTYLGWMIGGHIKGLRGFAIHRRRSGKDELLDTYVGFAGQTATPGTYKPSNVWPVQKFMWSDYMVSVGDVVQYQVVPVTGADKDHLAEQPALASSWSAPITVTGQTDSATQAYFNRGVVAAQWLARKLGPDKGASNRLRTMIKTPGDPTRQELGGELMSAMNALLGQAAQSGNQLFGVLFELNDPELMQGLTKLGKRASIVLANGAAKPPQKDENQVARKALRKAGVNVFDRMVPAGTLAHNKFVIVCDAGGTPQQAWSGSTNWTMTGLCTQSNNGILFTQPEIARVFMDQFNRLKAAKNAFPAALVSANSTKKSVTFGSQTANFWFSRTKGQVDLLDAKTYIDAAAQGILFLMFNPGPKGTLLNFIVDRSTTGTATYDPNLYVHGVLNQDPSTSKNPIHLFNRGQDNPADFDVVLPAAVNQKMPFWIKELLKLQGAFAMVHSKTIVIDAFGPKPVVMTGSHNMGPKASRSNDDNLIIIERDPLLAQAYAVYIKGIFDQYWWRFRTKQSGKAQWNGLVDNDTWQDSYFQGLKLAELKFWLGLG